MERARCARPPKAAPTSPHPEAKLPRATSARLEGGPAVQRRGSHFNGQRLRLRHLLLPPDDVVDVALDESLRVRPLTRRRRVAPIVILLRVGHGRDPSVRRRRFQHRRRHPKRRGVLHRLLALRLGRVVPRHPVVPRELRKLALATTRHPAAEQDTRVSARGRTTHTPRAQRRPARTRARNR